ncbi:MAG: ComF family protein [Vicinamibacterales bacterium]
MRQLADLVLSILLAPPCAVCGDVLQRPLDGTVCEGCWRAVRRIVPPVCDRCGSPRSSAQTADIDNSRCATCLHFAPTVDKARAIGAYDGALRSIVHAFKYEGRRSVANRLGSTLRACGRDVLAGADALVPIPLHARRRRARGFNQARILAGAIGEPVWDVLVRVKHTCPQVDLDAEARRMNVQDAFQIGRRSRDVRRVRGSVLVLVDDVATTGATLDVCAVVLKAAGAREVRALTAARVVSERQSQSSS